MTRPLPVTYSPKSANNTIAPLKAAMSDSPVQEFTICGADRQWKWASAKIEGDAVIVSSPEVPSPVAVRYAWAGNPTCNLYNRAGLPAAPFRTTTSPSPPPSGRSRRYD